VSRKDTRKILNAKLQASENPIQIQQANIHQQASSHTRKRVASFTKQPLQELQSKIGALNWGAMCDFYNITMAVSKVLGKESASSMDS